MATTSVVTGANSGNGRATAIHLAQQGHRVVGTAREVARATKLQGMASEAGVDVPLVELDVADDASVERGFAEIFDRFGTVDVLVNNAGVGDNGTVEDTPTAQYLSVMNVNLCGAVRCLQQVLPSMRERRSGTVINITSVAGRFGSPAQASYVASKWAFEGLSEELAIELGEFGIRVAIIEPGVTKSAIFAKNVDLPVGTGAYETQYRRLFDFYAAGLANATDPFEVAALIHHVITTDEPKLRYACSWGGPEITDARPHVSDEELVALGRGDDSEYRASFQRLFGLDITPPPG
jgi:NAD(P)-dependent dehydrogenase (short-subunit alcohol dehydrogenase family)